MNKLSFNKYNFIRGEQMKEKEDGIELMPNSDVPLLPSWDDELILPPTYEEHFKALSSKERAEREDD